MAEQGSIVLNLKICNQNHMISWSQASSTKYKLIHMINSFSMQMDGIDRKSIRCYHIILRSIISTCIIKLY